MGFIRPSQQYIVSHAISTMKQVRESANIVNTTTKPSIFFGRLHFLLEALLELQKYEKYHIFKDSSPSRDYRKITQNLESTVDDFIDRTVDAHYAKTASLKTDLAKDRSRQRFAEDLLRAFDNADTFWSGNGTYPRYTGKLYTSNNYQRVKKLQESVLHSDSLSVNIPQAKHSPLIVSAIERIDTMEGHDFEHWCAAALEKSGFINVKVTPASGDHGVDVLAEKDGIKYAVQCKRYSHDLGNTPVQEVHAGKSMYNCHVGVVITNQHFTSGAKQLAQATGVLLWDREWVINNLGTPDECSVADDSLAPAEKADPSASNESILLSEATDETVSFPEDDLYHSAVHIIEETGTASPQCLEQNLSIGYARASRLLNQMESDGIIGPFRGSAPRNILIPHNSSSHADSESQPKTATHLDCKAVVSSLFKLFAKSLLFVILVAISFVLFFFLTVFIYALFNIPASTAMIAVAISFILSIVVTIRIIKSLQRFTFFKKYSSP